MLISSDLILFSMVLFFFYIHQCSCDCLIYGWGSAGNIIKNIEATSHLRWLINKITRIITAHRIK